LDLRIQPSAMYVMPCSMIHRYWCFRRVFCLYLHCSAWKMEV